MSAAPAQAPARSKYLRRSVPRHLLSAPVDITVMRPDGPDSIPARARNVSEGGIHVVVAEQLHSGQSIAVEFRLPDVALCIRTKGVVRHQADLQCGVEFLGLTSQQREMIRYWTRRRHTALELEPVAEPVRVTPKPVIVSEIPEVPKAASPYKHRWLTPTILALVLISAGSLGWWYWQSQWKQLETETSAGPITTEHKPVTVSPEIMQQLLTHKVEPIYPENLRSANIQGIVALDTTIGPDGKVLDVRPVSGPDTLMAAAVDAVKWWRFEPYRVNGQPVEVATTLAVEFHP